MTGAKSVPALAKKYSTPRAASSSRYASAVDSTVARLFMVVERSAGRWGGQGHAVAVEYGPMTTSAPTHDLVIRNGLIVDGTGAPARRGDVAVRGDRVAAGGRG